MIDIPGMLNDWLRRRVASWLGVEGEFKKLKVAMSNDFNRLIDREQSLHQCLTAIESARADKYEKRIAALETRCMALETSAKTVTPPAPREKPPAPQGWHAVKSRLQKEAFSE